MPPPWWTTSTPASRDGQPRRLGSDDGRHAPARRRRAPATAGVDALGQVGVGGGEAAGATNSVSVDAPAPTSVSPSSWRTRYSSEPPTRPGRHHSRLTADPSRRRSATSYKRSRVDVDVVRALRRRAPSPVRRGGRRRRRRRRAGASIAPADGVDVDRVDEHGRPAVAHSSVDVAEVGHHRRQPEAHRLEHTAAGPASGELARRHEHVATRPSWRAASTAPRKRTRPARSAAPARACSSATYASSPGELPDRPARRAPQEAAPPRRAGRGDPSTASSSAERSPITGGSCSTPAVDRVDRPRHAVGAHAPTSRPRARSGAAVASDDRHRSRRRRRGAAARVPRRTQQALPARVRPCRAPARRTATPAGAADDRQGRRRVDHRVRAAGAAPRRRRRRRAVPTLVPAPAPRAPARAAPGRGSGTSAAIGTWRTASREPIDERSARVTTTTTSTPRAAAIASDDDQHRFGAGALAPALLDGDDPTRRVHADPSSARILEPHARLLDRPPRRRHRWRRVPRPPCRRPARGPAAPTSWRRAAPSTTSPCPAPPRTCSRPPARPTIVHLAARVGGIGYNQAEPAPLYLANLLMGTYVIEAARTAPASTRRCSLGTVCSYPKFTPVPFARGEPVGRLPRGDQRAVRHRQEGPPRARPGQRTPSTASASPTSSRPTCTAPATSSTPPSRT